MDLVSLTEEIVKSLVVHKEGVSVKEFPTANAIRTLVQASSALGENKYVKIDIDKF